MRGIDLDVVAQQLLRAMRGERSREAFARRLRVSANAIYAWETGRRAPSADLLFRAAVRSGLDLRAALRGFLGRSPEWLDALDPEDRALPGRLVDELRGNGGVSALADHLGVPRFAVSRWLGNKAVPRLAALLGATTFGVWRLADFVAIFTDPEDVPALASATNQLRAARRVVSSHPWAAAVLVALELEGVPHEEGFLQRCVGMSEEEERTSLELLEAAGLVRRVDGRWTLVSGPPVEIRTPASKRVTRAWGARLAADRIEQGSPGAFNFTVFAASKADRDRIEALHRAYVEALRAIALNPAGRDHVYVANVHLFSLESPPCHEAPASSPTPGPSSAG